MGCKRWLTVILGADLYFLDLKSSQWGKDAESPDQHLGDIWRSKYSNFDLVLPGPDVPFFLTHKSSWRGHEGSWDKEQNVFILVASFFRCCLEGTYKPQQHPVGPRSHICFFGVNSPSRVGGYAVM